MKPKFDIAAEMQRNLQADTIENTTHSTKITVALECLNKVADIFDNLKEPKYAEAVTRVIEKLAKK